MTAEQHLRTLLRQERENISHLNSDYRNIQIRNLELKTNLNTLMSENERLVAENQKLRDVIKKSNDRILSDHNYL